MANAGATDSPGTLDGTSGLPVRVSTRAAVDFPQGTTEAPGEDPGTAVTIRVSGIVPDGGASRESSATAGETIMLPQSSEVALAPANVQGPSEVSAETQRFAGGAGITQGKATIREATVQHSGHSVEEQTAPTNETAKPLIGPATQTSATEERATKGKRIAEVGAAGRMAAKGEMAQAEPRATTDPIVLQGNRGAEIHEKAIGVPPNSDGAEPPSDLPTPELMAAPVGPGEPATPAVSNKLGSPIRPVEPRGRILEGSPRAAIVDHHEKEPAPRRSTAGHAHTEMISIGQRATAGTFVAPGTPANTVASSIAGSPACAVAAAPITSEATLNSRSNLITERHFTAGKAAATTPGEPLSAGEAVAASAGEPLSAGKAVAASTGKPLFAKPGDLETVPEPESRLISPERGGHAGATAGHSATEGIGNHNTAEALNSGVVAAASAPRNSGGEATPIGAFLGAQPIHAAGGMASAQGSAPMVASASAHVPVSVTFERMDTGTAPQMIESTPHRLAVGVHSGGLGWVEIHASSAGGQVSATLASGSTESHHAIATQLPAVQEFLTGAQVRIDHLASERFSASSGGEGDSSGDQGSNGSGRPERSPEQDGPAQPSSADMEWEGLSYISVRV